MGRSRGWGIAAAVAVVSSLIHVGPIAPPAAAAPVGTIDTFMGTGSFPPRNDCVPATETSLTTPVGLAVSPQGDLVFADQTKDRVGRLAASGFAHPVTGTGVGGAAGDGGPALSAQVDAPSGVAVDSQGRTYIADWDNDRVRRIDPETGTISTFASLFGGQPIQAYGVAVDASDNVYIAAPGNNRVLKATPAGAVTPFAGTGAAGSSGDGGQATSAQLNAPADVAVDAAGNVYIVEFSGARVRKVTPGGIISTVAGTGVPGYSGDGGNATAAQLNTPNGIAVDGSANLLVADFGNHRVRRIAAGTNTITTVTGTGVKGFGGDGGTAANAVLDSPTSVEVDASGTIYIADSGNHRVRKIAAGVITTAVGTGTAGASLFCHPRVAQLADPVAVAVDGSGNVFVADRGDDRIRRVTPDGEVSTYAGGGVATGDGIAATAAAITQPGGLAFAPDGDLLIADADTHRVRRVDSATQVITTLAGNGTAGSGGDGGAATAAQLNGPRDVSVDLQGNTYIADSGNHRIRRVTPGGVISTFAGTGAAGAGGDGGAATSAQLNRPLAVHAAESGVVYVADSDNHKVRRILGGTITTAVGTGASGSTGDGGLPTQATLALPHDVITDESGVLHVVDTTAARVRKVDPYTGHIQTLAGTSFHGWTGDGGPATAAQLNLPRGLAFDASGDLYIADSSNRRVRKVEGERPVGFLRVTTSPAVPADIWVDSVRRDSWALTWLELPVGPHLVCATDVGALQPSGCVTVTVLPDQTTTHTFSFVTRSTLRVQTSPAVPSTIFVDGVPRNDWGLWTDVPAGNHEVCFGEVAGFSVPPCQDVVVPVGGPANVTGTFVASPGAPGPSGAFGYLRVTTAPPVASQITIEGEWRDTWGLTWLKVPTGSYSVCFRPVTGLALANLCEQAVVTNGGTTTVQGDFTVLSFLRVITSPAVPATIYVDGERANTSGVWTTHAPGPRTVCFGPVPGFATPPCQTVNLPIGPGTTTVTGTYAPG